MSPEGIFVLVVMGAFALYMVLAARVREWLSRQREEVEKQVREVISPAGTEDPNEVKSESMREILKRALEKGRELERRTRELPIPPTIPGSFRRWIDRGEVREGPRAEVVPPPLPSVERSIPVEAPVLRSPTAIAGASSHWVAQRLGKPESAQEAWVLMEILGPPKGLQP
jgi:hypothetical protein